LDYWVFALTVYDGYLIAGGTFVTAGGTTVNEIARWTGSSWVPLGGGMNGAVEALTVFNGELIAGGEFTSAGGIPAYHLARWDGTQWASFGGGSTNTVNAFNQYGGRLVAAGDFNQSTIDPQAAHEVVAWDGNALTPLGAGMNGQVLALKSYLTGSKFNQTNELVAGGLFTQADGSAASHVARWDQGLIVIGGSQWTAMGSGFDGGVYALERCTLGASTNTYAGGNFNYSGATYVGDIARWNSSTGVWESLGGMNGAVFALKYYNGYLYAGGAFTSAAGTSTGGLARWNGSSWSQCGGYFNGTVYSLEVYNGQLVIGGVYPGINSSPNLAQYDGTYYSTFGTGGTNAVVRALCASGSRLYIGGDFTTAGGIAVHRAAYWDGAWHDVGGGTNNSVNALTAFHGEVEVGGTFGWVKNASLAAPTWARWLETGTPWLVTAPFSQTVDSRANATFTVVPATGYDPLTYQWYKNGTPLVDGFTMSGMIISGANGPTLTLTRVESVDGGDFTVVVSNGCGNVSAGPATLTINQTVGVGGGVPRVTRFESLGPNPAHGSTRIGFSLARDARVSVAVYDVAGRRQRTLDLGSLAAGERSTSWDGRNDSGEPVSAGVYLVELAVDGARLGVRRLAMLR
ncbi:MAG TPA: FlgD immunoglobulin-like domain containing protein, partial [Dongiaceae bacterium]|nr:FlgD immunoglobulin-like domain containing protein [Dongiaceae bacterium]